MSFSIKNPNKDTKQSEKSKAVLLPFLLIGVSSFLMGCWNNKSDESSKSSEEEMTYVGNIRDSTSFREYLNFNYSYTEHEHIGTYYLEFTIRTSSKEKDYFFKDCSASIQVDLDSFYKSPILLSTSGRTTTIIKTQYYNNKESINNIKKKGCKIVSASGEVYKKNNSN